MDDEQLKREFERRSQAAPFRAEELLPEVRRWTDGGVAKPARFARWAPLAGLAGAVVIVVALVIAWPRSLPNIEPNPEGSPMATATRLSCDDSISIADETGLIESCSLALPTSPAATSGGDVLYLPISGRPCDIADLTFSADGNQFFLRTSHPVASCVDSLVETTLNLVTGTPIERSAVHVLLGAAAATPPATTPTPRESEANGCPFRLLDARTTAATIGA